MIFMAIHLIFGEAVNYLYTFLKSDIKMIKEKLYQAVLEAEPELEWVTRYKNWYYYRWHGEHPIFTLQTYAFLLTSFRNEYEG